MKHLIITSECSISHNMLSCHLDSFTSDTFLKHIYRVQGQMNSCLIMVLTVSQNHSQFSFGGTLVFGIIKHPFAIQEILSLTLLTFILMF